MTDRDDHTTDIPGNPPVNPPDEDLPATGTDLSTQLLLAALTLLLGAAMVAGSRRTRPAFDTWSTSSSASGGLAGSDSPPPVHRRAGEGPRELGRSPSPAVQGAHGRTWDVAHSRTQRACGVVTPGAYRWPVGLKQRVRRWYRCGSSTVLLLAERDQRLAAGAT